MDYRTIKIVAHAAKSAYMQYGSVSSSLAVKTAATQPKSACLEKVLYLGKPQERTFRYAD
jgi:hypothetical protein